MRMSSMLSLLGSMMMTSVAVDDAHAANELCGQTITQSLTLTADQTCTGDGLVLVGDKITIDLGGFTLSGDAGNGHDGIDATAAKEVVVKNGTIRNFDVGVATHGMAPKQVKLSNVTLRNNVDSGLRVSADQIVVDKGSAVENGTGLAPTGTTVKISGTAVVGNLTTGIAVAANSVTVVKALVTGNGGRGLLLTLGGSKITIKSSQFVRNGTGGIFLAEATALPGAIVVAKNRIVGNGGSGLETNGVGDPGHLVPVTVTGNVIAGNGNAGVRLSNDADDTVIVGNRILGNGGHGVEIDPASDGALVKSNAIVGNIGSGIFANNATATLAKNALTGNTAPITAPAGAVDGGGNTARAHVDPATCPDSITCLSPFKRKPGPIDPTCGMHVTASITLGHDTPPCDGDGLIVDASDVTIDLNGYEVSGNSNGGTTGIKIAGSQQGVKIINGIVRGFENGITMEIGGTHTLSNVEVRDNLRDGVAASECTLVVDKSSFVDNLDDGLDLRAMQPGSSIKSSAFVGNGTGLRADRLSVVVTKSVVALNSGAGVHLTIAGSGQLSKSLVVGNGQAGIRIEGAFGALAPLTIKKNELFGNGADGIVVQSSAVGAVLEGNVSGGNGGRGLALMGNPSGTMLAKNDLFGNATGGLFVDTIVGPTTITQNRASGNGNAGLNVGIATATLTKNVAVGNQLSGITTPFGAIDGGGNSARDNVADPQCTAPITCP